MSACTSVHVSRSLLQHPVTWQPSKEGDHLIGRITLSKRSTAMPKEAGALLGLKVRVWVGNSQHNAQKCDIILFFTCYCSVTRCLSMM